ncbi:putative Aldose 1-epimerase [Megalodesulfovibrio gigas DSM 1382 = ATCC 19364]|uniref:Putative Aldose 1-epimerase n=1 Tax=Megalodesulfovibrio gigas (strain ATCC 19364 / DSM 1382 / NCIMB 9332 / VKM B-1759) TaxID=1121448 RepID=T2GAM9_MEGG1|nr:putative Aldose 1-epimerase [Megalodesulfovibrio gigas DSM 1382 = ATCC 19364]
MRTELAGHLPDGQPVHRHVLRNAAGMQASILEYGAIMEWLSPPHGRGGERVNVLAGPDSLEGRLQDPLHCGALLGRFAGRIAQAGFLLGNTPVRLLPSAGGHHDDGGPAGLHSVLWTARHEQTVPVLVLSHVSPDGASGYPGSLVAQARYQLTNDNLLVVDMMATSTAATICNLAQHCCFNLAGSPPSREILAEHELEVLACFVLPEEDGLPVAPPRLVHGTSADLRMPTRLGDRLPDDVMDLLLVLPGCIEAPDLVARLRHPPSGRELELYTTRPGLRVRVQSGVGITLMDLHLPDSPNRPLFPSVVLSPGKLYRHTTVYRLLQR